jgi:hypothetical protein
LRFGKDRSQLGVCVGQNRVQSLRPIELDGEDAILLRGRDGLVGLHFVLLLFFLLIDGIRRYCRNGAAH